MPEEYYLEHFGMSKEEYDLMMKESQDKQNKAQIRQREDTNPISNAINLYFREFKHNPARALLKPKYSYPAAALAVGGIYSLLSAPAATVEGLVGSAALGEAVELGTKVMNGKTWTERMQDLTHLDSEPASMLNPGYTVGGNLGGKYIPTYGKFVSNNFANRGRFFFDNLNPASYKGHWKDIPTAITEMFYKKPKTFNINPNKGEISVPKWYPKHFLNNPYSANARLNIWARNYRIPENEIPNFAIIKNADRKSYRFNPQFINDKQFKRDNIGLDIINTDKDYLELVDWMTTAGGEHSDFYRLDPSINQWTQEPERQYWRFSDHLKLNPQYLISKGLKKIGILHDDGKMSKWLDDKFFRKPIGGIIGAKDAIQLELGFSFNPSYDLYQLPIIYFDPTKPIKSNEDIMFIKPTN